MGQMKEINDFSKQKCIVYISDEVNKELEHKLSSNFRDYDNGVRGERADVLFRWVNRAIYNIANDIMVDSSCRISGSFYYYDMHEDIGTIKYLNAYNNNERFIVITDIIWTYKFNPHSWYSIVGNKNTKLTYEEKKKLYESIMKDVSVIVKRALNQLD